MVLNLKILKMNPPRLELFTSSVVDQTDNFADAFVRQYVAYDYDILFREIQSKKSDILMFLPSFQCEEFLAIRWAISLNKMFVFFFLLFF